jgi:hypothetical protein
MKFALVLAVFVLVAYSPSAIAQNSQNQRPIVADPDKGPDENSPFAGIEDEMKAKRAIQYAEKEHQENLDRAKDLSLLGTEIVSSFKQKNTLDQDDIKKLEKLEKLAKGIRRAAGGSEDETKMEKPPADMSSAVEMLGDLSHSLKEKVEKTPKHVISAAVIDEANVLLELVRIVRSLPPKV